VTSAAECSELQRRDHARLTRHASLLVLAVQYVDPSRSIALSRSALVADARSKPAT
jgi:hypothetical protein